jgi:DNA repair exonuclease SbcCD ATPase subunit
LAQSDPMQYLSLHHQYTEAKEAYQTQIQQLSQLQQQAQQTAAEQQAQRLQREAQAMRQAIPEWKDQARANAEMTELKQFLAHAGFGEQEIASVADHRQVTLARKAMLYDKLVAQGKQKVATAPPPTAKPGSTAKPNTDGKKIREALKTTGKGEYAAKLIERML